MRVGMRWWLTLAFAAIAGVTAVAVARVSDNRSETAFRQRAQEIAAGRALQSAISIGAALDRGRSLRAATAAVAADSGLALFVFDAEGRLASSARSQRVSLDDVPMRDEALALGLAGRRFVETNDALRVTTVGLPLRDPPGAALVATASHPDLAAGLGILRRELVESALWAFALGGATGFVVASLIAGRLKRVARAAAAIERGDFDTPLEPMFNDELGDLAATFDRMRVRLRRSFGEVGAERDRLRRLIERLHDGVVAVDAECRVEIANQSARRELGAALAPGDPLPDPWPEFSLCGFVNGLAESGPADARVTVAGDRTFDIAGLPPRRGETAILVVSDVSQREREERAQREFAANAAHELRTPLTTIIGAADALRAGAADDPADRARFLAHIDREAHRLSRLANSLLLLARAQSGQEDVLLRPVVVRAVLEDVARRLRPREGVTVEVDCPPNLWVPAERDLLERALENVAANAVRHTSSGAVRLSAAGDASGAVSIVVDDAGPGVPAAERERVFERFSRGGARGGDGFGLGLAIARAAVRAQGGDVTLDESPSGGASVRITLRDGG